MVTGIIGKKVGMTQVFGADGVVTPVTVIKAGPCVVVQAKTVAKDGYEAVQLGLVEDKPARVNQALGGHYKKANVPPTRVRREVAVAKGSEPVAAGTEVVASTLFKDGETVDVIATSRGRGFQGVIEASSLRWRRGDARLDVPSRSRRHRRFVVPVARDQGQAFPGPHGFGSRDAAQLEDRARRRGEQPRAGARGHSGRAGRLPGPPQGDRAASGAYPAGGEAEGQEVVRGFTRGRS